MLAGFRMFPSYLRIGGLREDLPPGFDAVTTFLNKFPSKLKEYEDLLTKNQIWLKRTKGVGRLTRQDALDYGLVGPMARATGLTYDVRKAFPYLNYSSYDFDVPTATNCDVYDRYLVRWRRCARAPASRSRRSSGSRRGASSTSRTTASSRRRRTRSTPRWKR